MFYEYRLTIAADTPATSPTEEIVELDHGRIVGVELLFPRGCRGLVHVAVLRGLHQLWPTNPDGDIAGEDAPIRFQEDHLLDQPPYQLTLRGWSPGTEYDHAITFRFNVLPVSPPPPAPAPELEYTPIGMLEIP